MVKNILNYCILALDVKKKNVQKCMEHLDPLYLKALTYVESHNKWSKNHDFLDLFQNLTP